MKNEKLHFLKTKQSIYLRKSNGLSNLKITNQVLTFNITNGKEEKKLAEYVSMATKRGYLYHIFGSLN